MAPVGKDAMSGGGRKTGVRLVLLGGDTGGTTVQIRVLGDVGDNDEDGGEYPYGVTIPDHG